MAPMSGLILGLTVVLFPVPFVMAAFAIISGVHGVFGVAAFMLFIWAVVYFYMRPSHFEVTPVGLDIVWPLRREHFDAAQIESVERISGEEYRRRYGLGMRIGAGGLFGGFGFYKTKSVTFRFYISRQDEYVLVHRKNDRPLMLTPDKAAQFVDALNRGTSRSRDTRAARS